MREIVLVHGEKTIVDDCDYDFLSQWNWYCNSGYAVRWFYDKVERKTKAVWMHRVIVGTPDGMFTDHINHSKLDNRRSNLRICTNEQNQANRKISRNNTSGKKGVYWFKRDKKWRTSIRHNGKKVFVGSFENIDDAYDAYICRAKELRGEFAY